MRDIKIQLQADHTSKDILPLLIEELTLRGFTVVQNNADILITVEGFEAMKPPDNFGFSQTSVSILLKILEPNQNNRVLLEQKLLGEAASQNLFKSRQFALKNFPSNISRRKISLFFFLLKLFSPKIFEWWGGTARTDRTAR